MCGNIGWVYLFFNYLLVIVFFYLINCKVYFVYMCICGIGNKCILIDVSGFNCYCC